MLSSNVNVCPAASQNIDCPIPFSPCGNSDPGHGTRFVTLPSPILLYWQIGQVLCVWLFCKLIIVVVSTSSVVLSQVRWFFLMRNVFTLLTMMK